LEMLRARRNGIGDEGEAALHAAATAVGPRLTLYM
jgi:hypothetical protein